MKGYDNLVLKHSISREYLSSKHTEVPRREGDKKSFHYKFNNTIT
jgi:hypothetical protein